MDKYNATYSIKSKSKSSVSRKKKENRKKSDHRKKTASEHRKRRACIIFQSLGGSPVDWEYNPKIFGIPQIDNIDQETLLLFTSHTDKSCLRDLLSCKCFVGEAQDLTQVPEYMFNIVEINCSFLVQGFEAVNINIS